jgi:hypothetical protein
VAVLQIRLYADADPAFKLKTDPALKMNVDPDPGKTLKDKNLLS